MFAALAVAARKRVMKVADFILDGWDGWMGIEVQLQLPLEIKNECVYAGREGKLDGE